HSEAALRRQAGPAAAGVIRQPIAVLPRRKLAAAGEFALARADAVIALVAEIEAAVLRVAHREHDLIVGGRLRALQTRAEQHALARVGRLQVAADRAQRRGADGFVIDRSRRRGLGQADAGGRFQAQREREQNPAARAATALGVGGEHVGLRDARRMGAQSRSGVGRGLCRRSLVTTLSASCRRRAGSGHAGDQG
ncbi:hypothetical protein CATMIT_01758, partial [Catenibacterium mitsuokai DSM 15897]